MKIVNIKLDKQKISYIVIIFIAIILATLLLFLFINSKTIVMNTSNYTNILRDVHNDINKYAGRKIKTSGYIFRAHDFTENQFVIARDMLVTNDSASIVGFLCEYPYAIEFDNNVWVEVHGTIIQGDYYGPMPVIQIDTIKRITTPNDTFVYPPTQFGDGERSNLGTEKERAICNLGTE